MKILKLCAVFIAMLILFVPNIYSQQSSSNLAFEESINTNTSLISSCSDQKSNLMNNYYSLSSYQVQDTNYIKDELRSYLAGGFIFGLGLKYQIQYGSLAGYGGVALTGSDGGFNYTVGVKYYAYRGLNLDGFVSFSDGDYAPGLMICVDWILGEYRESGFIFGLGAAKWTESNKSFLVGQLGYMTSF